MRLCLKFWLAGWRAVLAPARVARGDGCPWASRCSVEGMGSPGQHPPQEPGQPGMGPGAGAAQVPSDTAYSSLSLQCEPPVHQVGAHAPPQKPWRTAETTREGPSGGLTGSPTLRAQRSPRKRLQRRPLRADPPPPPDGGRGRAGCDTSLQGLRPGLVRDRLLGRAPPSPAGRPAHKGSAGGPDKRAQAGRGAKAEAPLSGPKSPGKPASAAAGRAHRPQGVRPSSRPTLPRSSAFP